MTETKLLPCPFCGGADLTETVDAQGWPIVECADCGTKGPCCHYRRESANQEWNHRAAPEGMPEPAKWWYVEPDGIQGYATVAVVSKADYDALRVYALRRELEECEQDAEAKQAKIDAPPSTQARK